MKKKSSSKPEKKTWWTSIPGILTGITAAIVAVTGLIAAVSGLITKWPEWFPAATATPPSLGCAEYVRDIKTGVIQTGSTDSILFEIASPQSLEDVRLLKLESNSREVGKLKFLFSKAQNSFEIVSVVDTECRQVAQSASAGTSIDIKNGEEVSLKFNGQEYILRLAYKDNTIAGDLR